MLRCVPCLLPPRCRLACSCQQCDVAAAAARCQCHASTVPLLRLTGGMCVGLGALISAGLPSARQVEQAESIGRDVFEYVQQIDYDKVCVWAWAVWLV